MWGNHKFALNHENDWYQIVTTLQVCILYPQGGNFHFVWVVSTLTHFRDVLQILSLQCHFFTVIGYFQAATWFHLVCQYRPPLRKWLINPAPHLAPKGLYRIPPLMPSRVSIHSFDILSLNIYCGCIIKSWWLLNEPVLRVRYFAYGNPMHKLYCHVAKKQV